MVTIVFQETQLYANPYTVRFQDQEVRPQLEVWKPPSSLRGLLPWPQLPPVQADPNQNQVVEEAEVTMPHCPLRKFNVNSNAEKWCR